MKTTTLLILCVSIVVGPAMADKIRWANWSTNIEGQITTPQGVTSITYSGELSGLSVNYPSWTPSESFADGIVVNNAPRPGGGMIRLYGGGNATHTISFSPPLVNPVMSIWSLGQRGINASFEFIDATPIFVAGGPSVEFDGGPIRVMGNRVSGSEANGTVSFQGTFSSISWTNPVYEYYYGFTVGVASAPQVCQKKLAMIVNGSDAGTAGLYTINADGSKLTKLLSVPVSSHGGGFPRWSPDGSKIAFDAEFGGNDDIYVVNQDGTGLQQLTFDPAGDRDPAWSPDGRRMVFSSNRGGLSQQDLFVMDADGSNIVNLTNSPNSGEFVPDWSPDGTHILFDSYTSGLSQDIWIMNADGSGQIDLTPHAESYGDGTGRWSADGTALTFTSTRIGTGDVFMMNLDGTGFTDLSNDPAYDYGATSWSNRDGSAEIAFTSRRTGFSGVYTMNGDGTHQKAIFLTNALDNLYLDARK